MSIRSYGILTISYLAIAVLLAGLCSCGHSKEGSAGEKLLAGWEVIATEDIIHGDTVINCHVDRVDRSDVSRVPLSMLIDTLEIIKLENSERSLASPGICDISDNYIAVVEMMRDAPFKLYTRSGKFISEIGGFGQGPGEYLFKPFETLIDEKNGRLYIYPCNSSKILEYDLSGSLIDEIPLAFARTGGHINVDYQNKRILVVQIYFETSTFTSGPPVWVQDFEGNALWHTYEPIKKMIAGFSNYPMLFRRDSNGLEIYFGRYEAISDTIYYVDMNSRHVKPLFTATFDGDVPSHKFFDVGKYYIVKPTMWPGEDETSWNSLRGEILIDKKTLRGGYCEIYNDFLGGIELKREIVSGLITSNCDLTMMIDPGDLLDKIEQRLSESDLSDADRDLLLKLQSEISPDDNCYILHGNFIQPQK